MILFRKLPIKNLILQKLEFRSPAIRHKQLFYTCLTPLNRIYRKPCVLSALRYGGTNTMKTKVVNSTVQSVTKMNRTSEFKNLIMLASPEKWRLFGAITFLLVSSAVTMVVPFCLGNLIDIIYTSDKENIKENLNRLCVILFGVFVVGGLCNFCRVYLMTITGHRITQSIRKQLYAAILRQEIAMFDKSSTGELVGRLSGTFLYFKHSIR